MLDTAVTEIQTLYPRIYMACHVDHVKARSSGTQISARDSAILAHLTSKTLQRPGHLARHLKISPSTLSEALHGLVSLGYVRFKTDPEDERRTEFQLTDKGVGAMKSSSVLDSEKLAAVLARLSTDDQKRAIEGLRLLADAAIEGD